MSTTLSTLLSAMRRRLKAAWALATVQVFAPLALAAALMLVVLGRLFDLPWSDTTALIVVVCAAATVLVVAAVIKVPDHIAARAADRGLHTRDAFASALEFADDQGEFGQRIQHRAEHLATGARAKDAVPFHLYRRHVLLAGVLAPAALVLALIGNPQDAKREQRARDRATIAAVANTLTAEAKRLEAVPNGDQAAQRLDQLVQELAKTSSLQKADELLKQATAELQRDVGTDLLAKKAATQGLSKSLENQPLPGAAPGTSAQDQLAHAADNLDSLSDEQKAALADRLDQLADAQQAGDPAAADALHEAAAAVRAGNASGAKAKLGEAAGATASSAADVAAGQAAADAANATDGARDQVAQARDGTSSTSGTGSGKGQGSGTGDGKGTGSGSGSGKGSGSGAGTGGGGGNPSGNISGGNGGSAQGGTGGKGQGTGTSGPKAGETPDTDTIFDPVGDFGSGDSQSVGGGSGSGQGGTIGKANGNTQAGNSRVSLSDTIADYSQQATDALDSSPVPPSVRGVVVSYFDQLQGRN